MLISLPKVTVLLCGRVRIQIFIFLLWNSYFKNSYLQLVQYHYFTNQVGGKFGDFRRGVRDYLASK